MRHRIASIFTALLSISLASIALAESSGTVLVTSTVAARLRCEFSVPYLRLWAVLRWLLGSSFMWLIPVSWKIRNPIRHHWIQPSQR